jgi:hypothetical protein
VGRSPLRDPHSKIKNQKSSIINHQSSIINHQSSIINHQSSIGNLPLSPRASRVGQSDRVGQSPLRDATALLPPPSSLINR